MRALNLLAVVPALVANALDIRSTTACNNSPDLCDKSYSEITHLGAHDSPFVRDAITSNSLAGDQYFGTTTQLDAGVRLVTAQVHKSNGQWRLCHTSCELLDAGLLSSWLSEIKTWLDNNPNDVVTILLVNSDGATASELHAEFTTASITDYAYAPTALNSVPSVWPTLQTMIDNGKRLVTFVAAVEPSSEAPYLMDEWTYVWENPYDVSSPTGFSCNPGRPSAVANDLSAALSSNRLPLMNHFLYSNALASLGIQFPNASYVDTTNAPSGGVGNLGSTAAMCKQQWNGRQPTFILVDFYNKGPAIETVDNLNNVTYSVKRPAAPSSSSSSTQSNGSSSQPTGSGSGSSSHSSGSSSHSSGSSSKSGTSSTQSNAASAPGNVFKALVELANAARNGANPTMGNWIWVGGDWGSLFGGGIPFLN